MLQEIKIAGCASYSSEGETLASLKAINFIFGSNGVGKTTISRLISDPRSYPSSALTRPVIIDSHAVTKESYGYRVTPYSLKEFEKLGPTQIWVLYTTPEVARQRIAANAQGRPQITGEEARFHTQLQASVAITYGMHLGTAIHFFDSAAPGEQLVSQLIVRLSRP